MRTMGSSGPGWDRSLPCRPPSPGDSQRWRRMPDFGNRTLTDVHSRGSCPVLLRQKSPCSLGPVSGAGQPCCPCGLWVVAPDFGAWEPWVWTGL